MTIVHTIELRLWLTSPEDMDKLYSSEGKPSIYYTNVYTSMEEHGWIDLGVHKLNFTPPPRDKLVGVALEKLQDQLKKFGEDTANARAAFFSRIKNRLVLPFNPTAGDPQEVDRAPDEGTAL